MLKLAAFADEISPQLDEQIKICRENAVTHFELRGVADMFGLGYERVETTRALRAALSDSLGGTTTTLIEVPSDRRQNLAIHQRVTAAVQSALGGR